MASSKKRLPVDKGWSWIICFASFSCLVLQGLAIQATAVLFLDLVDQFNTTVTTASFSLTGFTLCVATFSVMSPTVLVPWLQERVLAVLTGICLALSSVGICLSPNVAFFIFFYSVQGACYGILCVTTSSLTSKYFRRRRALATTIVMTGLSLALVAAPTFIRALREEFGVRGAYLILAGVQLHVVPAACTLRPVSFYLSNSSCCREEHKSAASVHPGSHTDGKKHIIENEYSEDNDSGISSHNTDSENNETFENIALLQNKLDNEREVPPLCDGFADSNLGEEVESTIRPHIEIEDVSSVTMGSTSTFNANESIVNKSTLHTESYKGSQAETRLFLDPHIETTIGRPNKASSDNGSHYLSMCSLPSIMGSSLMVFGMERVNSEEEDEMCQIRETSGEKKDGNKFVQICKRLLFPELFRSMTFRFHTLMCFPCGVLQYLQNYVPTIAVVQGGVSMEESALLLTIMGAVDLVSRILIGLLTDTHVMRPSQIIATALFGLGTICLCNEMFTTFNSLLIMAIGMGCFIGTRVSLHAALSVELVGEAWMPQGMSVIVLGSTLSTAVHSPLLSAVMDSTSSFNVVLYYCGGALYVASCSLLLLPLFQAWDKKRMSSCPEQKKIEEGHKCFRRKCQALVQKVKHNIKSTHYTALIVCSEKEEEEEEEEEKKKKKKMKKINSFLRYY
ncbi:monocarboxylate transporter [Plakobranchus ocellatus]|uniref:Monocarboxylate transporter n=1 Tax=Plakobranchus ocellatus TaxID=259542 RepID=A0AAV4DFI7_9GAST|nr:monocarboxylate transporter [Plakobranchus ocellatus]